MQGQKGQGQVQFTSIRTRQERPPPFHRIPVMGRSGSEGRDVRCGAATVPGRSALVSGSGSRTKDREYFRNEILSDLICGILFDGTAPPPFSISPSRIWAGRDQRQGTPGMAQLQHRDTR